MSDLKTLRLGAGAAGFNWLPIFIGERRGAFERAGLKLEIRRLGSVDKATAAVKSGDVDLAITPPEGAIRDCASGGHLRIVAGNVNRLPLTLIANPRYRRIEDLRGTKLGTSSMTEGTALYTMEMLRQHGLNYPGDYEFSVVGVHPARWKALQEGTIDAAVQLILSTSSHSMPGTRISARSVTTFRKSSSRPSSRIAAGRKHTRKNCWHSFVCCSRRPDGSTIAPTMWIS